MKVHFFSYEVKVVAHMLHRRSLGTIHRVWERFGCVSRELCNGAILLLWSSEETGVQGPWLQAHTPALETKSSQHVQGPLPWDQEYGPNSLFSLPFKAFSYSMSLGLSLTDTLLRHPEGRLLLAPLHAPAPA